MKEVKGYIVIGFKRYEDEDSYPIWLGILHDTKEEALAAAQDFLKIQYEDMLEIYDSDEVELGLEDLYLYVCGGAETYGLQVKAVY